MARKKKFRDVKDIEKYINDTGKENYRRGTEKAAETWAKKTSDWINEYVPGIRAKYKEVIDKYGGVEKYLESSLTTKFDVARQVAEETQRLARVHLSKALEEAKGLTRSGISVDSYKNGRAKARQTVEDVEEITF
jgi:hypothetical protein